MTFSLNVFPLMFCVISYKIKKSMYTVVLYDLADFGQSKDVKSN